MNCICIAFYSSLKRGGQQQARLQYERQGPKQYRSGVCATPQDAPGAADEHGGAADDPNQRHNEHGKHNSGGNVITCQ